MSRHPEFTPETIELLAQNQTRELELRNSELLLQKQKDDHGFTYASKLLEIQAKDRTEHRNHQRSLFRWVVLILSIVIVSLVGLIGAALYLGKDALAMEIVKTVVFVAVGGIGGYGLKSSRQAKTDPIQDD